MASDRICFGFRSSDVVEIQNKKLPKRQAMFVQRHTEARSREHCCQGKAISIKCYKRVSVFLPLLSSVKILFSLSRIKLQSAACLKIPYFPTLFDKQHASRKKITKHRTYFDFLYQSYPKHLSLYDFSGISYMYTGFNVKYPLSVPYFNQA